VSARNAPRRSSLPLIVVTAFVTLLAVVAAWAVLGLATRSANGLPAGAYSASAGAPSTPTGSAQSQSKPVAVDIPQIGAQSSLVELGLNPDGSLQVPPVSQPLQAGWYAKGPKPGEPGPAVIAGHVDGGGQKGIFYRLHELRPGDVVDIQREDGTTARFAVQRVAEVPKNDFPTDAVYGPTPDPQLRVITCGGAFDSQAHSYNDNIIVFATLVA
jgi:sortase family protein